MASTTPAKPKSEVPESFNKSDYTMTGSYVVGSSSSSKWVYDVAISHNGKKIYVVGFTPEQHIGREFSQLGMVNPYYKFVDDFKNMAREYAKGNGVPISGDKYYQKYIKYKAKYMNLKNQ